MHPTQPTRSERGFWHLVVLQFQGAFSDNLYKQLLVLGIVGALFGADEKQQGTWNAAVGLIFVLPMMLFAIWSGFLADKFSKRTMTLATKAFEIVIMTVGTLVFLLDGPQAMLYPSLFVLFLMSAHSSFFSPNKYGIIPELVSPSRLSWANGIIEMTTFIAIISGVAVAAEMLHFLKGTDRFYIAGIIMIALACGGFLVGLGIDKTPAANPTRSIPFNFIPEFKRYCRTIRSDRTLFLTVLGLAYFWGLGVILLQHVITWGHHSLELDTIGCGRLYFALSVGIGVGAFVAGNLSHGKIELGLIPLGGIGMAFFALPLAFATPDVRYPMYFCLCMLGVSAGFYSLPLNAILQSFTKIEDRGGMLAANNFFNAAAMVFGSALLMVMANFLTSNQIFMVCSLMTLVATVIIVRLLPESLVRFVAFLLTNTIYRIRTMGVQNIPAEGGVLLVCNHIAYVDALLIQTACPRKVRFIVWEGLYDKPVMAWFLRTMRSIPVSSGQKPKDLIRSLNSASEALAAGEVVCIFAEGHLTRTGMMAPFQRGYEKILAKAPAPVVPVCLDGVWGSIFSFEKGKFIWKWPRRIPYPVRVAFGEPFAETPAPAALRQRILELSAEAAIATTAEFPSLAHMLIQASRRKPFLYALQDTLTPPLSKWKALVGAIVLARRLRAAWGDQKTVGVMLPPSVAAALVNYAAALTGRTVVNLNYTIGAAALESCVRSAGLKTVITTDAFLKKLGIESPAPAGGTLEMTDYRAKPSLTEMLGGALAAWCFPARLLTAYCGAVEQPRIDSIATIIFSSGSTGEPKGVILTHGNIVSNIESFRQGFHVLEEDRMLGVLPFFHSFGYTVSLWGGALCPCGLMMHFSPIDLKTVAEILEKQRITIVLTTPTFLQQYMRRIPPAAFGGVKTVVTGAERLPESMAAEFHEKFGIMPLQGFGTTECAPVVSVNIDDHRSPGFMQVGKKKGSIGHPLPGVAVRIVDAETGALMPVGESGMLHVKGPNVMQGYLGMPEKTAEVLVDGWYNTGDVGRVDEDGFLYITGRLSRFSKIGGEMVPHGTVEDKLADLIALKDGEAIAVTGVPDASKGERLVVLHSLSDARLAELLEKLPASGLPNLFIPRRENFHKIEALPVLGTGKLDLRGLQAKAKELDQPELAAN